MDNSKYEAVRAKIVEACLDTMEIVEYCGWHDATNHHKCKDCIHVKSVLSLSHVLRAIKEGGEPSVEFPSLTMTLKGRFKNTTCHLLDRWDLTKDDLSLQSPETIDFLFKILCG